MRIKVPMVVMAETQPSYGINSGANGITSRRGISPPMVVVAEEHGQVVAHKLWQATHLVMVSRLKTPPTMDK